MRPNVSMLKRAAPALLALTTFGAVTAPVPTATVAYPATGLLEGSGITASVRHPGVVWVMEDSGDPIIHAYGPGGADAGSVTMLPTGADDTWGGDIRDAEALAMGPGPTLWVADIGDNDAVRESIVVHEVPEPAELGASSAHVASYRFTYPAGPRDAETYLVDPVDGRAYIVTKGFLSGGLYTAPLELTANATHALTFVQNAPAIVTDGSFSPDGSQVVLRTASFGLGAVAYVYDVQRGNSGEPIHLAPDPVEIAMPDQEQGESICFTLDGTALLTGSEGVDEPIWSVPLTTGSRTPGHSATGPPSHAPTTAPAGSLAPTGSSNPFENSDPSTVVWVFGGALALVVVAVMVLAERRRRR